MSDKKTSVIGLPTNPLLVEKAAQILGICSGEGLVFGNTHQLEDGKHLMGDKIDLAPNRYVMYAMSDHDDGINHPDVRLVVVESNKVEAGIVFAMVAVLCIASEDTWRVFARVTESVRSDEMKDLVLRAGIKNLPVDGMSIEPAKAQEYITTIASWAAKQIPVDRRKSR